MPPREFLQRLRAHNANALFSAALCLATTVALWGIAWLVANWLSLLILSAIFGENASALRWLPVAFASFAAALYLWAAIDFHVTRFRPPLDHPILGLHAIRDVLLYLPRTTFAIGGNLSALILLSRHDKREAWTLLLSIAEESRSTLETLAVEQPNMGRRIRLLRALQLMGFVDLHSSGRGEFFYLVRSDQKPMLRLLKEQA